MTKYIVRRLLLMVPTILGITIAVFALIQFVPGGPVEQTIQQARAGSMARGGGMQRLSPQEIENIKAYFGFDKPVHERYATWLGSVLRFDFGRSFSYQQPAWDVISARFPISLFFGLTSLVLAYVVSIPLGLLKALKHRSAFDNATSAIVLVGYVIPGWALGIFLLIFLGGGSFLNVFPLGGIVSENFDYLSPSGKVLDFLHHMTLPLFCYMVGAFAVITLLMKNSSLEELNRDYFRTALAKGVPARKAVVHHALRNAMIPIATGFGALFTVMFAGALLIERVFDIDGMGLLMYNSIVSRDYNVVMAIILMVSLLGMFGRLFSDLMYGVLDPRVRLG